MLFNDLGPVLRDRYLEKMVALYYLFLDERDFSNYAIGLERKRSIIYGGNRWGFTGLFFTKDTMEASIMTFLSLKKRQY